MKIIDADHSILKCQVCGAVHSGKIKSQSGGRLYKEAWQCQNGCIL
ncbi:MAG TPA: hypothetical protein VMZ91_04470 [Candidatus Paceibacterota bacterium]|nr:hypothetical protein [Candidatus Paceibacterota bacterium]